MVLDWGSAPTKGETLGKSLSASLKGSKRTGILISGGDKGSVTLHFSCVAPKGLSSSRSAWSRSKIAQMGDLASSSIAYRQGEPFIMAGNALAYSAVLPLLIVVLFGNGV